MADDIEFVGMGTAFKSQKSDFVVFGFAEKCGREGIQFYLMSSKLAGMKDLSQEDAMKLHELFKGAGSYKDAKDTFGVKQIYLTENNVDFIQKFAGISIE